MTQNTPITEQEFIKLYEATKDSHEMFAICKKYAKDNARFKEGDIIRDVLKNKSIKIHTIAFRFVGMEETPRTTYRGYEVSRTGGYKKSGKSFTFVDDGLSIISLNGLSKY